MAFKIADRVLCATSTTGTGTITLGSASPGYQAFSAALANNDTCPYVIRDGNATAWECGIGTYASGGNTLARTLVTASSSGGSLISITATAGCTVSLDATAAHLLTFGASLDPSVTSLGSTQGTAYQITQARTICTTVGASTGVVLPVNVFGGMGCLVVNRGLNALKVWPGLGAQIESLGTNNFALLTPGASTLFIANSPTQWYAT